MLTRQYNDCQDKWECVSVTLFSDEPTVFTCPVVTKVNNFFRQIPFINLFPGLSPEWLPGWRDMDLCDRALCQISASSDHLAG